MTSRKPTPHKRDCPVYIHAHALIGADRRGMCKCGADDANEARLRKQLSARRR